jgi:trimethylamine--corrinoid protein Co-methyltransferase
MIDRIGPGGHFLQEEHTLNYFKEVWYSDLFDRSIYDIWVQKGAKRFDERLREKTLKIMQHQPAPISEDILQELDNMAKNWK